MSEFNKDIALVETSLEQISESITQAVASEQDFILLWAKDGGDIQICFISKNKSIRALEFMDYLVSDYAMIKGDEKKAEARLSNVFLQVMLSDMDMTDIAELLQKKIDLYFTRCQWIYADEYLSIYKDDIPYRPCYIKQKIPWAYVQTTDIVKEGEKFKLKSLENESNIIITASADAYIMIGCLGEIYNISRDKFQTTYEPTTEKLDAFQQMLCYLPEVQSYVTEEFISLDELAKICYPKESRGIFAIPLEERTKVFTPHNGGEYFVGRKGDYLAIRKDDWTDIYVIQKDIFHQTYVVNEV